MYPDKIFYEPAALDYELGRQMREKFGQVPWIPIANHNNIEELRTKENREFSGMKRHLIIGVRKSLKHTPNHKISEIIFMTYSYVHRAINSEAFPNAAELYDKALMTGRGRGKYCYREEVRTEGEQFLREQLSQKLSDVPIVYVV